jgi:photosystem II stability/assembly factor-like uncharacterized protein
MQTMSFLRTCAFTTRRGIAAVVLSLSTAAASAQGALPPQPVVVPATRVAHAAQATMLAATRAGGRIVAAGDHGIVLVSDDGGRSHRQAKSVPIDATLTSVSFVDASLGWAAGHWGAVLRSDDGGETWTRQRLDTSQDRPLFAIHFFDANNGVAVGLWSLVLVTADAGKSWQKVELAVPEGAKKADLNLFSLFVDTRGRVFAAGEKGMVLRSDDRGRHWTYLPTGYKGSFWTGLAAADGTILVAGLRGSMYRSIDDGRSWERVETHTRSSITALARADGDIIGVGLDGLVLRSQDGGASFKTDVRADRASLTALAINNSGQPVLYSTRGVVAADANAK